MKNLLPLFLAASLAISGAAFAGGPVIVTEEAPIADVRPQGDGGKWVVPVVVGLVVACFLICNGGGDDSIAPPTNCNGDGDGCHH